MSTMPCKLQEILICGHRSFAATGLDERLQSLGHRVTCFTRGPLGRDGQTVTGPVSTLYKNPHLNRPFDTVINYIMIKNGTIQQNEEYTQALLKLCQQRSIRRLVHVSSISVYADRAGTVNEASPCERNASRKGSYGALKVASEISLLQHRPPGLKLSLVRPGFILGKGLDDPIVGMAYRFPWNRLLILGNGSAQVPLTSRHLLNLSMAEIVESVPQDDVEVFLIADSNSPTRAEYLEDCCKIIGCAERTIRLPRWTWFATAMGVSLVEAVLRPKKRLSPPLRTACQHRTYDATITEQRLNMRLAVDWKNEIRHSMPDQTPNFELPYTQLPHSTITAQKITYIGFGRVVQSLHLPALRQLAYVDNIVAYDLEARRDNSGIAVQSIRGAKLDPSDLFVVASPGPAHGEALELLGVARGPVLVEKPLCLNRTDLGRWAQMSRRRGHDVSVCHNYRFKANVAAMMRHLSRFNPGRLHHVQVHLQCPPVRNDGAHWLRDERRARSLLMDYGIHFLDLACMLCTNEWKVDGVRIALDGHGHTNLIEGRLTCSEYSVSYVLRQGFMPRRARIEYTFQNYMVSLGFFPETFTSQTSHDNPIVYGQQQRELARATRNKILEKLTRRSHDCSHAMAYVAATQADRKLAQCISLNRVRSFYEVLLRLADRVYTPLPTEQQTHVQQRA